jgi:DNA polymerase V
LFTGFPSAAEEYRQTPLNLQLLLVRRPRVTFYAKFIGDAMTGANIWDQDLLIIERAESYQHGQIVLAFVESDRLVRRLERHDRRLFLCPANPHFQPIELTEEMRIFGRVIHSITHHLRIKELFPSVC